MRRFRVPSCFASSTQQMNSLRAKGVMSLQAASAPAFAISAWRKSTGSSCTTPPGTVLPFTKGIGAQTVFSGQGMGVKSHVSRLAPGIHPVHDGALVCPNAFQLTVQPFGFHDVIRFDGGGERT